MNQEIKTKWLEALASGKYSKGKRTLKYTFSEGQTKYCCLGVLCELHSEITGEGKWENDGENVRRYIVGERRDSKVLPWNVVKWADLKDRAGTITLDKGDQNKLVARNLVSILGCGDPFITEINDNSERDDFEDVIPLIEKYL